MDVMGALMALHATAPWLRLVGGLVLAFGIIAYYRIESLPLGPNRAVIWTGAGLLVAGALAWVAPFAVVYLGARPA